jgi:hypothetical protein
MPTTACGLFQLGRVWVESIQAGLEVQKKEVSAKKVIVSL